MGAGSATIRRPRALGRLTNLPVMRRSVLALLAFACLVPLSAAQEPFGFEDDWTSVLQRIVQTDQDFRVAYDEVAGPDFDRTLAAVETFDPARLTTDDEKLAFWINAYNVKMVEAIAARPNARHLEKQNLFDDLFKSPVTVAGREVTLDQIEHVILRRQDGPADLKRLAVREVTPLIHVGLNCAAVSCPPLRREAYLVDGKSSIRYGAGNVRGQLRQQMKWWVVSERFIRDKGGLLVLSSLVDWFGADFDGPTGKAGDFLAEASALAWGPCGVSDGVDHRIKPLQGLTAAQIKALPNVRFEYDWAVARAK